MTDPEPADREGVFTFANPMPDARPITEHVEWAAVAGPEMCRKCGHKHYGRIPGPEPTNLAPQWGYCEDDFCDCSTLVRRGYER